MNISISEKYNGVVWTLGYYNIRDKWPGHDSYTFNSFCFSLNFEMTWYLHVLHLWCRSKTKSVDKRYIYYLVLNRINCIVELFFIMFIIIRGMTTSWIPFITLVIFHFFVRLFSWQYFTPSQFSTGLLYWWEFMLLHTFINLHFLLTFY